MAPDSTRLDSATLQAVSNLRAEAFLFIPCEYLRRLVSERRSHDRHRPIGLATATTNGRQNYDYYFHHWHRAACGSSSSGGQTYTSRARRCQISLTTGQQVVNSHRRARHYSARAGRIVADDLGIIDCAGPGRESQARRHRWSRFARTAVRRMRMDIEGSHIDRFCLPHNVPLCSCIARRRAHI